MRYKTLSTLGILFALCCMSNTAFAEPSIQGISGVINQNQNIIIEGQDFGVKSPAAPLLWDDGEGKTTNSDTAVVNANRLDGGTGLYSDSWPALFTDGGSDCQEEYRTRYRVSGFRGKSSAHQYSQQYLAGGHYDGGCNGYGYMGAFKNVGVVVDSGTADKSKWFATWYYGLDPNWQDPPVNGGAANHKMDCIQYDSTVYGGGGDYSVFDNNPSEVRGQDALSVSNQRMQSPSTGYHMTRHQTGNNPLSHEWVRWERRNKSDSESGVFDILIDNELVTTLLNVDNNHANYLNDTRAFLIGGYFRWQYDIDDISTYHGGNNNYRYFDDIYVDTTWARVMLANSDNYDTATIVEPQIPSAWSANNITCAINLGRLPDDQPVYLFVFDSDNNRNQLGIPLQIGSEYNDAQLTPPPVETTAIGDGIEITGLSTNTINHTSNLTITGQNFGSKSPVAPLIWDDGTEAGSVSNLYDVYLPNNAQQGNQFNMAYRNLPFRGVEGPNDRVDFVLAGAHATNTYSGQYASGGNVVIGKNTTSHNFFINYYYRIDPSFDEHNRSGYSDNLKELSLSEQENDAYGGTFGFYNWCTNSVPDINFTGQILMSRMPITPENRDLPYGCSGNNRVFHNNPINGWVKMQWEGEYDTSNDSPQVVLTTYPDGARADQSHYGDGLTTDNYVMNSAGGPKLNDLRLIGIGGFARIPRQNNGVNSYRYFTSIYMDNTYARVMLGDHSDYDSCTIMEPQIPMAWNSSSINIGVNLGNLPDNGTAYLYVFDEENNHNTTGYPVNIGSGVGGSNNSTMPRPMNLRIAYPLINITSPSSPHSTSNSGISINGLAVSDASITNITWNNDAGGNGNANFTSGTNLTWSASNIPLTIGINNITITVQDSNGKIRNKTIEVNRTQNVQYVQPSGDCGTRLITGFDYDLSSWGRFWNYWKGFQTLQVSQSGDANCLNVRLHGFESGTTGQHTDSQVGYAIYADNNGEPGTLMVSGYQEHYNWEEIGPGMHTFPLNVVHTTRRLESGSRYWIIMICPDTGVHIDRNGGIAEVNRPRRGSNSTDFRNPPPASSYTTEFSVDGYSWSIW